MPLPSILPDVLPESGGGGGGTPPATDATPAFFNGTDRPRLMILAGFGGTLDPGAAYIHLGVGPGLGTGLLGGAGVGVNEVDITAYTRSADLTQRGPSSDIDAADPVTCTLILNNASGIFDPQNPASPYAGQLVDGTPIRVRWIWQDVAYDRFYGELSSISHNVGNDWDITATIIATDGMEKLGRAYLPQTVPVNDAVITGSRVAFLLDQASYPTSLRAIDAGSNLLGPTILGTSALELLRKVESTEYGLVFADGPGRLVFYDRHRGATAARSTAVQATFGDAGGMIPLKTAGVGRGRGNTFNRVAVTRDPAPTNPTVHPDPDDVEDLPLEQVADDLTAQALRGVLALPSDVGSLSRTDDEARALAQYLVDRYAATQDRLAPLDVSTLSCATSLYATLLGLGPWDRIAVSQDYGPATISSDQLIQGVTETIDAAGPSWELQLLTSPPPPPVTLFILGTSQLGSGMLGW